MKKRGGYCPQCGFDTRPTAWFSSPVFGSDFFVQSLARFRGIICLKQNRICSGRSRPFIDRLCKNPFTRRLCLCGSSWRLSFHVMADTVMQRMSSAETYRAWRSKHASAYIVLYRNLCANELSNFLSKLLLGSPKKKIDKLSPHFRDNLYLCLK